MRESRNAINAKFGPERRESLAITATDHHSTSPMPDAGYWEMVYGIAAMGSFRRILVENNGEGLFLFAGGALRKKTARLASPARSATRSGWTPTPIRGGDDGGAPALYQAGPRAKTLT